MKSLFDKLNLRPAERRLVVIVGIIVFVVVNVVFVYPIFGDYGRMKTKITAAEGKSKDYDREIKRMVSNNVVVAELEKKGSSVTFAEAALQAQIEVTRKANLAGVTLLNINSSQRSSNTKSNAFFEEQSVFVTVSTTETNLIDFLYSLGSDNSLIRVRSMTLRPDQPRYRVQGDMTLVASFQKKQPTRVTTTTTTAPAPGKAAAPAPKPVEPPKKTIPAIPTPK